jgi:hypothetical protein
LARVFGEEGFKADPAIYRGVMGMFSDPNWKIRKIAATYL